MMAEGDDMLKKKNMGVKARHIPEEIALNILPNLPVASLQRFRCVSKQWCSWISLTITHRRKFITKSGSCVSDDDDDDEESRNGTLSIQSIDQTTSRLEDVKDMPWEDPNNIQIYGSCNGLLLIGVGKDLFLWNPFLGCHVKLLSFDQLSNAGPTGYRIVGGLCYDTENNEYKPVMALSHDSPGYGGQFVVVGSPRNKTWKRINFPYNVRSVLSGPVFNNRLHWIVNRPDHPHAGHFFAPNVVVYFDAKIGEFVRFPMPPVRQAGGDFVLGLGVLDCRLCMTRSENYEGETVEVLEMKEYGKKQSWSILFKITGVPFSGGVVPLFFVGNKKGKVLLKVTEGVRDVIIVYDTDTNLFRDVTSVGYDMDSGIVYEETLVRPVGYGWEELDSRGEAYYLEDRGRDYIRTWRRIQSDGHWTVVKSEERKGIANKRQKLARRRRRSRGQANRR